jgi:hypothetical protein
MMTSKTPSAGVIAFGTLLALLANAAIVVALTWAGLTSDGVLRWLCLVLAAGNTLAMAWQHMSAQVKAAKAR